MYACGGNSVVQPHSMGRVMGGGDEGHTQEHTHTGTYMRMLHLPFSDLPLKKCPMDAPGHFFSDFFFPGPEGGERPVQMVNGFPSFF